MLNLDAAVQLHGLTLFRDFNDPQLYWYMPNSPRLAREGRDPLFQLLLYRDSATPPSSGDTDRGGGFLTMTVDLAVPEATLEAVKGELASTAGGPVRLAAVPFESGSVRVTALGVAGGSAAGFTAGGSGDEDAAPARPAFVENMLGFTKPSMYGDNRAAFSFELSQKGAILMEASLEDDGASAIAVLYDLEYMGLRPAREVKIVIEYQQSYHHLRNRVQANTLWFKADIDSEMERLTQSGAITIEDVTYIELEPDKFIDRLPSELSGGQKQRIGIARALAAEPRFIICDEVTSALDQLVAEGILRLLDRLQTEFDLAYMFITHDLATVKAIADEVVVMKDGRVVEQGPKAEMFAPPHDPYTELLLSSVPEMDPDWLDRLLAERAAGRAGGTVQASER